MLALRLTQSKLPLSSAAILEIFQRIRLAPRQIRYEVKNAIFPLSGDIFIIDALDSQIVDGYEYLPSPDVFREEEFDVLINRTKSPPSLFRFTYYNREHSYRIVHYLVCEKKTKETEKNTPAPAFSFFDSISEQLLCDYSTVQNILFKSTPEEEPDELDYSYWAGLVKRNLAHLN